MKLLLGKCKKSLIMMTAFLIIGTGGSISTVPIEVQAASWKHELAQENAEDLKYPKEIVEGVYKDLRKETRGPLSFSEALGKIDTMSKVDVMDSYLGHYGKKISPEEVRRIVNQIYGIDLDAVSDLGAGNANGYPDEIVKGVKEALDLHKVNEDYIMNLSKVEVMDLYVQSFRKKMSGPDIRTIINGIFGINLDGISGLEGTGVSLFSKEQWISQYERDLFVVHTGITDVDVWVYPTDYFTQHTGLTELPLELQEALKNIGFSYNEEVEAFYYSHPTGESVPDDFKGQTLGTIIAVVHTYYEELK
ncbi:hypothetical protein GCM10010954_18850 [Halobacillus andaensis]|uniref:Uncharacterized protein n=1 Tax=Halobacillus andaensis TaxID=1176239 RepID=A0A917B346_HALAA|nr:hypothetical protein [Halobacillus andaensis]MBP2004611.1 putative CopG family antitoxin [Halobacillus andaensis]GGF20316.1 hypothetical protein GCM10010954_18850 [Halobacillus andaensis]